MHRASRIKDLPIVSTVVLVSEATSAVAGACRSGHSSAWPTEVVTVHQYQQQARMTHLRAEEGASGTLMDSLTYSKLPLAAICLPLVWRAVDNCMTSRPCRNEHKYMLSSWPPPVPWTCVAALDMHR